MHRIKHFRLICNCVLYCCAYWILFIVEVMLWAFKSMKYVFQYFQNWKIFNDWIWCYLQKVKNCMLWYRTNDMMVLTCWTWLHVAIFMISWTASKIIQWTSAYSKSCSRIAWFWTSWPRVKCWSSRSCCSCGGSCWGSNGFFKKFSYG